MRRYEFESADDANAIPNAASVQECTLPIAKKYNRRGCAILGFLGREQVQNRPPAAQLKVQPVKPFIYSIGCIFAHGRNCDVVLREHAGNRKTSQQFVLPSSVQGMEKTQEAGAKPGTTFGPEGKRTGKAKQGKEAKTGSSERKSDQSRRSLRRLLEERHSR